MNTPAEKIRSEIAARGALPFARFMELALYCPEIGYYETKKDNVGRHGDFYTSVSVGNLFGEMLAFQFSEWLEALRMTNGYLQIVEAGAHDGQLAKDILSWLQSHRPKQFSEIKYIVVEPSSRRQNWQKETLKYFSNVRWFSQFNDSTIQRFNGIIFSNELLDAMPVHRFGWNAAEKKWFEWGVALDGDKFIWTKIQNPESKIQNPELENVLPDNYTVEFSPAAEKWWCDAANILGKGKLLTFDYGLADDEIFSPARPNGTLRAYFQHHASDDILANAGQQDITAHVNFSAIQKIGEVAGLTTEFFGTQSKFLTEILAQSTASNSLGGWNSHRARQFQTLTHPEHLGRVFRVLVQSR